MKNNVFILLMLSLSSCTTKKENGNNYKLSIDTLDFNLLKNTDTLNKLIYIRNESDTTINITGVEAACGCTTVLLKDSILKIGDSLPVTIQYIPAKVKDSGNVQKYITFRSNSSPPFVNLIMRGKIIK